MTDTAAKRASAMAVSSPWRAPLGVELDNDVADNDRAVTAYLYSGIDYDGGGGSPSSAVDWLIMARRRSAR